MKFSSENIRLVIVEDSVSFSNNINKEKNSGECCCEIKIKKSFLTKVLSESGFYPHINSCPNIIMTNREIQVLKYLAEGLNNYQISKLMNVSVHTIKAHIHNIFEKLAVQGRTEAVVKAIKDNLISL